MPQKLALFPRGAFVSLEKLLGIRGARQQPRPQNLKQKKALSNDSALGN